MPNDASEQPAVRDVPKAHWEGLVSSSINDIASYTLVALQKLLLRSGDVEAISGPNSTKTDFCIIHLNTKSIKTKKYIIEAQADQFDVITVSETWPSKKDTNSSMHWTYYHPPIRLLVERLRVRIPAGAAGEFSSPELTLCAESFSVSVPPPCYRSGT